MPPDPLGVSCVIPVYNEAPVIVETLRGVRDAFAASGRPFEIIVVDDGSTDDGGSVAEACEVAPRVIRHRVNRGYGAAIKSAVRVAEHPWIFILDADGTYPPEEIPLLLAALDEEPGLEMIVGQREQTVQTDHATRVVAKRILTGLASYLAGEKIPDLNSGMRLMRKAGVERFWPLLPDGFSLTTTITLASLCSGLPVRFVPITYRKRKGVSKIRPIHDMINFISLILRTMIYFKPLKVFAPASFVFTGAAFAVVILSKILPPHQVMDVTSLFLFITGLQCLLIGFMADLILKIIGTRA